MHVLLNERERAEAELRESQQLLASVADNISEAIYRTGPDHQLIFANRAYLRLSGYASVEEMQQLRREELYAHPPDRARLLHLLEQHDGFRNLEIEYVRRDGHRWWGLNNGVTVRDPETGAVLYHVGSIADITERKLAEAKVQQMNETLEQRIAARTRELSESEARMRTLVENAPEAIVVFDGDTGQFISGNAPACELFGCCAEALPQLNPAAVSPEFQADGQSTAQLAREKIAEALAGGAPVFEWMHRHVSGRLIPTEVRLVRLPGEHPRLIRASIIDNSERKRRERIQQALFGISEAAHTAEDLDALYAKIHAIVKTLVDAENFYIALIDPDGRTFSFPFFVDEKDLKPGPMRFDQGLTGLVLKTGQPLLADGTNTRSDGEGRAVVVERGGAAGYHEVGAPAAVWLGVPLTIRGRTFGVVAVQNYRNAQAYGEEAKRLLTFVAGQIALAIERKRGEQALRDSEEKFRAFFEASSTGVMIHDEEKYLAVNSAAAAMLGYASPAQLVGLSPVVTSPPVQPGGMASAMLARQHIQRCLTAGRARFDWVAQHTDGREIPVEVILTRIEMGGRQVIQAVVNDISERKRAEAELLRSLAREKELSQLKTNFVSMVSHEFRTPLGIILSSAEILEEYLDQLTAEERKEQLQSIQRNSRRMAALMEEALLLGRFEAGKMDFKPAPLDLHLFCQRLRDEVLAATERQCPIQFQAVTGGRAAVADDRLLRHIFTNLLTNAVKYSPPGTPVDFHLGVAGTNAVCVIRDRGIGIPESDRERLFEAFHRGRNVGDRAGTGLGLTIVKRCVELHGGHLQMESQVGTGTTVTVSLPVFPPAELSPT